ncbi:sensor domain-containing protein [Micromonospora sp. NPDC050686]|uniref:sensor histidine kinase n=1 Tax=Micromonospora sp. NPDC050686 TaxID=3154631 RepID=UPI003405F5AC
MRRFLRTVLAAPVRARTGRETLHLLLGAPLSAVALLFVGLAGYAALASVTVVGLGLLAGVVTAARGIGVLERLRARRLLDLDLPPAAPRARRHPGAVGWVRDALSDRTGWRCLLHALVAVPVGVAQAYLVGLWWLLSLATLSYPLWGWLMPLRNGQRADEIRLGGWQWYPDRWPYPLLVCAVGVVGVLAAPWLVAGLAGLDRLRLRALRTGSTAREQVELSERRRVRAVEQSGAQLRRIERDLHDGVQARMVALALELGRARADIGDGLTSPQVAERVTAAHEEAKQALAELRELARGIYPAVLTDLGLDGAVPLLTARCPIPVDTDIDVPGRPSRVVETNAYFCIAELLTNITKHSAATSASVRVRRRGDRLLVVVGDDGRGGARIVPGGGLDGVTSRVDTAGGTVSVTSPAGGPTEIRMELPCEW